MVQQAGSAGPRTVSRARAPGVVHGLPKPVRQAREAANRNSRAGRWSPYRAGLSGKVRVAAMALGGMCRVSLASPGRGSRRLDVLRWRAAGNRRGPLTEAGQENSSITWAGLPDDQQVKHPEPDRTAPMKRRTGRSSMALHLTCANIEARGTGRRIDDAGRKSARGVIPPRGSASAGQRSCGRRSGSAIQHDMSDTFS